MSECIAPGTISDEALAAYALDPQEEHPLVQHLKDCVACQGEVELVRSIIAVLDQRLYRFDCPSIETLDAYVAHETAKAETKQIKGHLKECLSCQKKVEILQEAFDAPLWDIAPPTRELRPPTQRARLFATRMSASLATRRSGAEEDQRAPQVFAGEGLVLTLYLEPSQDQVILTGKLQGYNVTREKAPDIRLFQLSGDTREATSSSPVETTLDARGQFLFEPVAPGFYQLEVSLPEYVFVVGSLEIR